MLVACSVGVVIDVVAVIDADGQRSTPLDAHQHRSDLVDSLLGARGPPCWSLVVKDGEVQESTSSSGSLPLPGAGIRRR